MSGKISPLHYLRLLVKDNTGESSKSFALVMSTLVGILMGLCVCAVLLIDIIQDGQISTNLSELGIFVLCVGGYTVGSGIPKAIVDKAEVKMKKTMDPEENEEEGCE